MRVVIKPAGILILLVLIAALSGLAFFGLPRSRTAVAGAADATTAPASVETGHDLLKNQEWGFADHATDAAEWTQRNEAVPGVSGATMVQTVTLKRPVKEGWMITLFFKTPEPVVKDEMLRLVLRARSAEKSPFMANFEQGAEPFAKSVSQEVATDPAWKQYTVPVRVADDYAAGGSQVSFHCGLKPGTLQFADIHLYRDTK